MIVFFYKPSLKYLAVNIPVQLIMFEDYVNKSTFQVIITSIVTYQWKVDFIA